MGGNPQDALKSGTIAPGNVNDPTGKGNSCDTEDDQEGCIFSQNLLVEDATADEINAAVSGSAATSASSASSASGNSANSGSDSQAASAASSAAAPAAT